jgi:hypothetical protein
MTLSYGLETPNHVMARHAGQETVILDLHSGIYYTLDETGSRIWQLASEGCTLAQICQLLLAEYDVDPNTLEQDVRDLAEELERRGLARRSSVICHTTD